MIGIIDVGSNSVRLMLAEREDGDWIEKSRDLKTTRLIQGMRERALTGEAIERTASAITEFAQAALDAGATRVFAFGTSAVRDAVNSSQLISKLQGIKFEILSGEDEAALAFAGANVRGRAGVIDIGGGSTELVVGEMGIARASACVRAGAVRLMDEMGAAGPEATLRRALIVMEHAWEQVKDFPVDGWTGVSGTMKSLKALELGRLDWDELRGMELTRAWCEEIYYKMFQMSVAERRALPGMNEPRADILPYGAAILLAFFGLSGEEKIAITFGGDNLLGYARMRFGEGIK